MKSTNNWWKENAYLRENNISALVRRDKGFVFMQDSVYQQKYIFIPALVTKTTTTLSNNYLIINQGSKQGIMPEMGVISSEGIVGIAHTKFLKTFLLYSRF